MPDNGTDDKGLSEQLRAQGDAIGSIGKAMDKILWVISDPDVGIVKRLSETGQITGQTVVAQTAMVREIALLTTAVDTLQTKQDKNIAEVKEATADIVDLKKVNTDATEAKKPFLAIGWSIVEKLIMLGVLGAVLWLATLIQQLQ